MMLRAGLLFVFVNLLSSAANSPIQKFEVWGNLDWKSERMVLYMGFTNGLVICRQQRIMPLMDCLNEVSTQQAIAMIDGYYKQHPERWSKVLGDEILEALTVKGGPCEGKNPFK